MSPPGTFITAVIVLVVFGALVQVLVLLYRRRKGNPGFGARAVDGDVMYGDDRVNEILYAKPTEDEDEEEHDFDPEQTETVTCPQCDTLNEASYTFCRSCAAALSDA